MNIAASMAFRLTSGESLSGLITALGVVETGQLGPPTLNTAGRAE